MLILGDGNSYAAYNPCRMYCGASPSLGLVSGSQIAFSGTWEESAQGQESCGLSLEAAVAVLEMGVSKNQGP